MEDFMKKSKKTLKNKYLDAIRYIYSDDSMDKMI